MARRRRTSGNVVTDKITRVSTKSATVQGRPGYVETGMRRRLPSVPPFRAKSIRTLIKRDEAKGLSLPEASAANRQPGQVSRAVRVLTKHLQPQVPAKLGRNQRVVSPPSPTSGGGIRNPYKRTQRVGRGGTTGVSKRFGTKGGTK